MMGRTHVIIGVSYGVMLLPMVIQHRVNAVEYGCIIAGLAVGSLIPDLDHPHSIITRKIPVIGRVVSALVAHRGLLHSIAGVVLWSFGVALIATGVIITGNLFGFGLRNTLLFFGSGFLTGYVFHIIADIFTPAGVRLFFPLRYSVRIGLITTGGLLEYAIRVLLVVFCSLYIMSLLR